MAKTDDTLRDDLPPIPELSITQANRLMCADYLRQIALLIEQGAVSAFDMVWLSGRAKPEGKIVMSSSFIVGPVEAKLMRAAAEYKANSIQVVDAIEDLKNHEPCGDQDKEDCPLCNTKLS